jgi:phosphoglycerate kinase
LKDIDIKEKRVLIYVDFDVFYNEHNSMVMVAAKGRLKVRLAMPTIQYCIANGARSVILVSHLRDPSVMSMESTMDAPHILPTLQPLAKVLADAIGHDVTFVTHCTGPKVVSYCADTPTGSVILLEKLPNHDQMNVATRDAFYAGFSQLADVFVNDNFTTIHTNDSTCMLGTGFTVKTFGMQIARELKGFNRVCFLIFLPLWCHCIPSVSHTGGE